MPKSYSGDLRERVIEAVETGASRSEAAECFEISPNSAVKWLQAWHDHGVCAPKPRGGSRSVLEDYAERILDLIAEYPDRTLDELVVAMRKRRIPGSRSALWRFLDRHESLLAAEQHRADVARAGRRWVRQQEFLDTIRLVFLDETATSTNMVRLRGRCPRGVRLIGHVLQGPWKTMTFVAALRLIRW
jgi:transposase